MVPFILNKISLEVIMLNCFTADTRSALDAKNDALKIAFAPVMF